MLNKNWLGLLDLMGKKHLSKYQMLFLSFSKGHKNILFKYLFCTKSSTFSFSGPMTQVFLADNVTNENKSKLYIGGNLKQFWTLWSIAKRDLQNTQLGLYLCAIASWNTREPRRTNSSWFTLKEARKWHKLCFCTFILPYRNTERVYIGAMFHKTWHITMCS